ncbi:hypothetical protein GHT06_015994 [Daphnia sinensis]|uniref:CUB domain-containing protein n=1 Tax=Daphnia sinensis TaxID=1820382 RepID=A0AAD5LC67_9CRUS|nr:hypothetical protein GHT06_015994 [Daphnia sinensis]
MSTFCVLLSVLLLLQVSRACDGNDEEDQLGLARQQTDDYYANAYGFTPDSWNALYHQSSDYPGQYEGRTTLSNAQPINPFAKYFANRNTGVEVNPAEGRFAFGNLGANLINSGVFNNRFTPTNNFRPFQNFNTNRVPIIVNPNFNNPVGGFDDCTSPSGDSGICVPGKVCSLFGGRPSGSCLLGKVCCINAITSCGGTVTLNNTYWQSPTTAVTAPSTCALTVRMNSNLAEQLKKPICQVRLDFVSFTTAQPVAGTCTDTFTVGGSTSVVPTICGDNTGQHMYLDVPSSALTPTDVQLIFNFPTGAATRAWNIKIAMLPCGASYLAPADCLQYYTSATGRVRSFNWQDAAGARQLNNQNYNICFRTELVSAQRATQMCVSVCTVNNGGDAFSITTTPSVTGAGAAAVALAGANSAVGISISDGANPPVLTATCLYDFLVIAGARDVNGVENDRYCGSQLNPTIGTAAAPGAATSIQVCTPIRPFKMTYRTDGTEGAVAANAPTAPIVAIADNANTGFCLDFQER